MNTTDTAAYWKNKAEESQNSIRISINTAMPLDYDDMQAQIEEAIKVMKLDTDKPIKTYTTIYHTHHTPPTAEEIAEHVIQVMNRYNTF